MAVLVFGLVHGCGEPAGGESAEPRPDAASPGFDPHAGNRALYDPDAPMPPMSPEEIKAAVREIDRLWHLRKALFRSHFLGIPTQQSPTDAWVVQEILSEVRPDLMIETGTFKGGSALLWAMILENLNPRARVLTIDIQDQRARRAKRLPLAKRRVDFLLGSSTDPAVVAEVQRRAKGLRVVVLLDSLHTTQHIANELVAYAPLVPVGSYVIVQDTGVGGVAAIEEFLADHPDFQVDRKRERFGITNTHMGYLKRVR